VILRGNISRRGGGPFGRARKKIQGRGREQRKKEKLFVVAAWGGSRERWVAPGARGIFGEQKKRRGTWTMDFSGGRRAWKESFEGRPRGRVCVEGDGGVIRRRPKVCMSERSCGGWAKKFFAPAAGYGFPVR